MKEKEAATTAAVPFHWCTLLELITSITMSPSLQMNMNCHVHVLPSAADQFQESAPVKWDGGGGGGRLFLHEF